MKVSSWQDGKPPSDGVWQILVDGYQYYARFKDGLWSSGQDSIEYCHDRFYSVRPYHRNNDPLRPIKWRGIIE